MGIHNEGGPDIRPFGAVPGQHYYSLYWTDHTALSIVDRKLLNHAFEASSQTSFASLGVVSLPIQRQSFIELDHFEMTPKQSFSQIFLSFPCHFG